MATYYIILLSILSVCSHTLGCNVYAQIDSGWVCGLRRLAADGSEYASFRGVPYAEQPVGDLRFQELRPAVPWQHIYNATEEGPVCPQTACFGAIMQPHGSSEGCIYANVHVPNNALPTNNQYSPYLPGMPILVFIHGGGFECGSGDSDMYGPEYLVSKGVIVITFNYRLNFFGFLSLPYAGIPGNNGLRDMVTLLRWVQRNARAFGGDPTDVTLVGQSAGAASAHLLSISQATIGLFKRVVIMSGTAIPSFYTTSPDYARYVASLYLDKLGINSTDPIEIHRQLIEVPTKYIVQAGYSLQEQFAMSLFGPVVETPVPGYTTVLDDDPVTLIKMGRGKDLPLIIGITSDECEYYRTSFEKINILQRIKDNPLLLLPPSMLFRLPRDEAQATAYKLQNRYFNSTPSIDGVVKCCSDSFFKYPIMKYIEWRAELRGAPVYFYRFAYEAKYNVLKKGMNLTYSGVAHVDDVVFLFRVNTMMELKVKTTEVDNDDLMSMWMTTLISNFIKCGNPSCTSDQAVWPAATSRYHYQNIATPYTYQYLDVSKEDLEMVDFYDSFSRYDYNYVSKYH